MLAFSRLVHWKFKLFVCKKLTDKKNEEMKRVFTNLNQMRFLSLSRISQMILLLLLCSVCMLQAQVATNYSFTQNIGAYTPITGGTLLSDQTGSSGAASIDDVIFSVPIPFTFTFDGTGYTTCTAGSNGALSFGAITLPAGSPYTPISSTTGYSGAIAAYGRDLQGGYIFAGTRTLGSATITAASFTDGVTIGSVISGTGIPAGTTVISKTATTVEMSAVATSTSTGTACYVWNGEMRYEVLGAAGNRILVIQWSNMKPFGTSTLSDLNGFRMNMQIRLYEVDNAIEVVYGTCTPGLVTSTATAQVGLRGPNNTFATNVNNRLVTKNVNDWATSAPGTTNASALIFNNVATANVIPAGLTYRWALQPPCTGTPAPGNTLSTASPACSGVSFTLSLQNQTPGLGVSYQWYVSTNSASGPWTPVGSSTSTFTTSQTVQSWYYADVTCSAGPSTGSSNVIQIGMNSPTNCYCSPTITTVEPICLVQFAGINNSTCSAVGCSPAVENFTAGTPGNVMPGQSYEIIVSGNTGGNFTNHFRAFFDWDQDGVFETSVIIGTILNTDCVLQATTSISVPMGATLGSTRMRILKNFNTSPTNACGTYSFGQAEDYTIIVSAPIPPCNSPGTPNANSVGSNSATLSWAAAAGATLYRYSFGTGSHTCGTGSLTTGGTSINLGGLAPNTTYTFCVRTDACGVGSASPYFSTTFTTAPLSNDNCSGAIPIVCNSTVNGSTVGALSDAGMGICSTGTGGTPGLGVWYSLAGDGSQITLSLCGSTYDTKLHVYSGSCGGLTCVASNDDSALCSPSSRSHVVFNTAPATTYYILVSGFGSNTGAFSMNVGCVCGAPLSSPWINSPVGSTTGEGIDNVCGGSIDITSTGYSPSSTSDAIYFSHQTLCGNQSITVKVQSITNGGFAGIMFRDSTNAGSRFVAIKTQLNNFVHREVRTTLNGARVSQQLPAFGHVWLRLTRSGSTFTGFTSTNGMTWNQAFSVNVALNSCIRVGLFTQGLNPSSAAQAKFSMVSGFPDNQIGMILPSTFNTIESIQGLTIFPNPASNELNLKIGTEFLGKDITINVMDQMGRVVLSRNINELQTQQEQINVSNLPGGMYILSLMAEGQSAQIQKFIVSGNRP